MVGRGGKGLESGGWVVWGGITQRFNALHIRSINQDIIGVHFLALLPGQKREQMLQWAQTHC